MAGKRARPAHRETAVAPVERRLDLLSAQHALGHHHPATALALIRLGGAVAGVGNVDEAESAYRRALAILQTQPAPDRTAISRTLVALGLLLLDSGRLDDASTALRRADALLEVLFARDP